MDDKQIKDRMELISLYPSFEEYKKNYLGATVVVQPYGDKQKDRYKIVGFISEFKRDMPGEYCVCLREGHTDGEVRLLHYSRCLEKAEEL